MSFTAYAVIKTHDGHGRLSVESRERFDRSRMSNARKAAQRWLEGALSACEIEQCRWHQTGEYYGSLVWEEPSNG